MTPKPPCSRSSCRAGNGFATSSARNRRNPRRMPTHPDRNHEQRQQHAHDFVYHNRPWIDASQIFLARPRQRESRNGKRDDEDYLDIRERRSASRRRKPPHPLPNRRCLARSEKTQCIQNCRQKPLDGAWAGATLTRDAPRACGRGDRAARDDRRRGGPGESRRRAAVPKRNMRACEAWRARWERRSLPVR